MQIFELSIKRKAYNVKPKLFWFFIFTILIVFGSCKDFPKKERKNSPHQTKNSITYAKGFSLYDYSGYKKLTIHTSFQGDTQSQDYFLVPKASKIPKEIKGGKIIHTPIERIVATSTTHIPMIEILGVENTLVGFPNSKYISSEKTRNLINQGKIKELGHEQSINTELLIELQPELVIGFGVNNTGQTFKNIQKMGIPVIMNSDWLEQTPLGRAEWIRFFGALYDKDSLALRRFTEIATNYNKVKDVVSHTKTKPTTISGSLFQDVWHMPAGESFMAQFLADANVNYLWQNTSGTGSLSLSLESVLEKGKNAEFWIAPGFYTTKESMLLDSPHYKQFKAFKEGNMYTYASKKGATGGVIFFELAPTRPDLVLQDLVKIFYPTMFTDKEMAFFNKLEE